MKNKKYIGIFCSAAELEEKYVKPAEEFARLMAQKGYHLVWGGTDRGLMKVIADEVQKGGGELIGVTIDVFKDIARKDVTEIIISTSLGERKSTMLLKADVIVALVGGVGTLDELTEVIELKKQGKHNKPIVVLNTDNFYEGLKIQLQRMQQEGFIHNRPISEHIYFADTVVDAMKYIESASP